MCIITGALQCGVINKRGPDNGSFHGSWHPPWLSDLTCTGLFAWSAMVKVIAVKLTALIAELAGWNIARYIHTLTRVSFFFFTDWHILGV